jgi:hydroquinone glucosyltransferase
MLVASPGADDLIPMAELARRLVAHQGLAATLVTFAGPDDGGDARSTVLSSLRDAGVDTSVLPAAPLDGLPADARVETVICDLIGRSIPRLRALLRDVAATAPLAALVPGLFAASVLPLAEELGVPGYLFFPGSLSALYVLRHAVELNADGAAADGKYRELPDPLQLPSGVSLRRADIPDGFRDSKDPAHGLLVEEGRRRYRAVAGFLVNTFYEMDPRAVEEFKQAMEQGTFPPAYPVGPLVRSSSDEDAASPCIEWLDRQPTGSVVYVSFGSAGSLSVAQTVELAAGLEDSGHRFLWAVRMPSLDGENSDSGKSRRHRAEDDDDPLAWLPEGFLERTSCRGLAVAAWAPQSRVLYHPAAAVFVSDCGWNLAVESVASGVPMVAWPLDAEQKMNAAVLSERAGVALRLGTAVREEVAAAVRELMEGEEGRAVRWRTWELRQAADKAWAPEGSSRRALEEVAGGWKAAALGVARNVETCTRP